MSKDNENQQAPDLNEANRELASRALRAEARVSQLETDLAARNKEAMIFRQALNQIREGLITVASMKYPRNLLTKHQQVDTQHMPDDFHFLQYLFELTGVLDQRSQSVTQAPNPPQKQA